MALRRRDYGAVVQSALECLQRVYNYPLAHFLLGLGLAGMGEYERAAEAMNAALAINPNFPEAHRRLATLLRRRLNDPAGSAEHWRLYREVRHAAGKQRFRAPEPPPEFRLKPAAAPVAAAEPPPVPELPPLGEDVLIVSGLPRSGTSMLMQMLAAGGVPVLTDGLRTADEDNPLGYFEFEPVKDLFRHDDWVTQARGKAVKVVAPLLRALPEGFSYRVVFIERDLDEILASQAQMLIRRGQSVEETAGRSSRIRREYARLVDVTKAFLSKSPRVQLLSLEPAAVLGDPRMAAVALKRFAGGGLDLDRMAAQVKPELHRQHAKTVAL